MRKLVTVLILLALGWQGYAAYQRASLAAQEPKAQTSNRAEISLSASASERFVCDGRTHCAQMTSCDEATYFINHCPGTKMDGDNDGVPCESQWCAK